MSKILDKLFWTTAAKLAVINWLIVSMPESTKKIVLGRLLAKHLPMFHLHLNPRKER